jgi:hypothetical protein
MIHRCMATLVASSITAISSSPADAIDNPLNLKGSYWGTGELYQKSDQELSSDPEELLRYLKQQVTAFSKLSDVVVEGNWGEASRLLRGGDISESQIRLQAYALMDQLEDDDQEFRARELFRTFLRSLNALDRTIEAAARQAKLDGGLTETLGLAVVSPFGAANEIARVSSVPKLGNDPRLQVLAVLDETRQSLQAFNKVAADAIQSQKQ